MIKETLLARFLQGGTHDPTLPVSAWALAVYTSAPESAIPVQVPRRPKRLAALLNRTLSE